MSPLVFGLITSVVFVGVLLTSSFIYWSIRTTKETRSRSLTRRLGGLAGGQEDGQLFQMTETDPLVDAFGFMGRYFDHLVRQAGSPFMPSTLALRILISATTGAVVLGTVFSIRAGILGLLFGLIPWLHIRSLAARRTVALSEQLPDALDLVGRSLQAGHGMPEAMRLCAEEMPLPLARELGRVYEQHNLGRDFRECMTEMANRNPHNFDLRIFVSAVLLQRETGGNLIEILDNISATVRARFVFEAKVRSLTAEARMSSTILGALPFVVSGAIAWLRPDYILLLFSDPLGRTMLLFCLLLFGAGVLLMRSLARVEA